MGLFKLFVVNKNEIIKLRSKPKKGLNTKTFFAFLPVKCGSEIRWLETVTIQFTVYGSEDLGYWKQYKKFI